VARGYIIFISYIFNIKESINAKEKSRELGRVATLTRYIRKEGNIYLV